MSETSEVNKAAIGDRFLQLLLSPDHFDIILDFFADRAGSITEAFSNTDCGEIIEQVLGDMSSEQVKDLLRPAIADAFCRIVGAKSVTIVW